MSVKMSPTLLAVLFASLCQLAGPLHAGQRLVGAAPPVRVEQTQNTAVKPDDIQTPVAVAEVEVDSGAIQVAAESDSAAILAVKKRVRVLEKTSQDQALRISALELSNSALQESSFHCSADARGVFSENGRGERDYCAQYACNEFDGRCHTTCRSGSDCLNNSGLVCSSNERCVIPPPPPEDS